MDLNVFYATWLEQNSQSLSFSFFESFIPVFLMFNVLLSALVYRYFRSSIRFAPVLNGCLIITIVGSFHACGSQGKVAQVNSASSGPITSAPPTDNTQAYFDDDADQSAPWIRLLMPASDDVSDVSQDYELTNPDCLQYNFLGGSLMNASCEFVAERAEVRAALESCTSNSKKYLRMDLKADYEDATWSKLYINHADVFPLLVYCIDASDASSLKIQVLNPEHLSYNIRSEAQNIYSFVSVYEGGVPGWFRAGFLGFENNRISDKSVKIHLKETQFADLQIATSWDKAPGVEVIVRPEIYVPKMAEYNEPIFLTDNRQELFRGSTNHGAVNVATGELSFAHTDISYPLRDVKMSFDVTRTYRSTYSSVEDFGYNWSLFPRQITMRFELGAQSQPSSFYFTGEGRYVRPWAREGIFLANEDDPSTSIDETAHTPSFESAGIFQDKNLIYWPDLHGRILSQRDTHTKNNIFYVYEGNQVVLMADQILARQAGPVIHDLIATLKSQFEGFTDCSAVYEGEFKTFRDKILSFPGNFVWFHRNSKGYVQQAIDKTGNSSCYTYDQAGSGDRLEAVVRYAYQDPMNSGVEKLESLALYQYEYANRQDYGALWRGLISNVGSYLRDDELTNIAYEKDPALYGEAPVVKAHQVGPISYTDTYSFNLDNSGTTVVEDSLGRQYTYSFDDIGFVNKIEAPTETKETAIVFEAYLDRKLLRVVNSIQRGVESITRYNEAGELSEVESCADRQLGSQQQVVAQLATSNAAGVLDPLTLKCESSLSRKSTIPTGKIYQPVSFINLSGEQLPLEIDLPDSTAVRTDLDRRVTNLKNSCLGGMGLVQTNGVMRSGSFCSYQADPKGGQWLRIAAEESFMDGTTKLSLSFQDPTMDSAAVKWGQDDLDKLSGLNALGLDIKTDLQATNQTGFYNRLPSLGYNKRFDPSGIGMNEVGQLRELTGVSTKFFDPYGYPLAEQHSEGGLRVYYYNYLTPDPVPVAIRELDVNRRRLSGQVHSDWQSLVTPARYNPEVKDFETDDWMKNEILFSVYSSEEALDQYPLDLHLDPVTLMSVQSFNPSGTETRYTYFAEKRYLLNKIETISLKGCTTSDDNPSDPQYYFCNIQTDLSDNDLMRSTVTFNYDEFDRLLSMENDLSVDQDGSNSVITRIEYQDSNNRMPIRKIVDEQNFSQQNGFVTTTETLEWDWAGRPLKTQVSRSGSEIGDTSVTYEYSPFGEVVKQSSSYPAGTSQSVTSETVYLRDPVTGVVAQEKSSQAGGTGLPTGSVDTETYVTSYSDFDDLLQPRVVKEENRGLETRTDGVPGKSIEVQVSAPSEYRSAGGSRVYKSSRTAYDGCGNQRFQEQEMGVYPGDDVAETKVFVDDVFCSPIQAIAPNGRKVQYDYTQGGRKSLIDERGNSRMIAANRYDDTPGIFTSEFLQCARAENGRCAQPGAVYSFSYNFTPHGQIDGAPTSESTSLLNAASVTYSVGGIPIRTKQYSMQSYFPEVTNAQLEGPLQYKELSPERVLGSDNAPAFTVSLEQPHYSKTEQNGGVYEESFTHPVSGGPRLQYTNRRHPVFGEQIATSIQNFNLLGMLTSTQQKIDGTIVNTSEVQSWHKGQDKDTFTQSGSVSRRIEKNFANPASELPSQTVLTKGDEFSGTSNLAYDGMGDLIYSELNQVDESGQSGINLNSRLFKEKDMGGRLAQEILVLEDQPTGASSRQIGMNNFSRDVLGSDFGSSPESSEMAGANFQRIFYDYGKNNIKIRLPVQVSSGGGEFVYDYKIVSGNFGSGILMVTVTSPASVGHPNGTTHRFRLYSKDNVYVDQFVGGQDSSAGLVKYNSGQTSWPPNYPFSGNYLSNTESLPFEIYTKCSGCGDQGEDTFSYIQDTDYRRQTLAMAANGSLSGFSFPGFSSDYVKNGNVSYFQDQRLSAAGSEAYRSCDNTYWENNPTYTNTLSQMDSSQDHITVFDNFGNPALLRRSYAVNAGTANQRKWRMSVFNTVDVNGAVAVTEELIEHSNAAHADSDFRELKARRMVQTRRFHLAFPNAQLVGGAERPLFRELVADSKNQAGYTGDSDGTDYKGVQANDLSGDWFYVPGPKGSPVMAFRYERENGSACNGSNYCYWRRYDFIYDVLGNVKNFYPCKGDACYGKDGFLGSGGPGGIKAATPQSIIPVKREGPQENEMYYTFGNSIVARYTGTQGRIYHSTNCPGSGAAECFHASGKEFYSSVAPQIQPRMSRFGVNGGRRDILNMTYTDVGAQVYDPFNGKTLSEDSMASNQICVAGSGTLTQAQSMMMAARSMLTTEMDSNLGPRYNPDVKRFAELDRKYAAFASGETFHPCRLLDANLFRAIMGGVSNYALSCWAKTHDATAWAKNREMEAKWVKPAQSWAYGVSFGAAALATGVAGVGWGLARFGVMAVPVGNVAIVGGSVSPGVLAAADWGVQGLQVSMELLQGDFSDPGF